MEVANPWAVHSGRWRVRRHSERDAMAITMGDAIRVRVGNGTVCIGARWSGFTSQDAH